MRSNKGFTLVEILIVVIILGILAAIVIPQFTNASEDARASSMAGDLQTVRSQIELYKVQHKDQLPDTTDSASFIASLTTRTDADGNAGGNLGPYLHKFPTNPYATAAGVSIGTTAPTDGTGWWFDTSVDQFKGLDADGNWQ